MKNMTSNRLEINLILFFKILLGITVLTVFHLALFRDFDRDEFEAVHSAWKILSGERIYLDFFQHHHPFFYYFIGPVISLVGESSSTLHVLRMFMFGFFIGMLWCTFQISDLVFGNRKITWLAVLFLSAMTMFSQKAIEIRPDVPQVFLGLLAIVFLWKHVLKPNQIILYLSAICMAISFLFLQKTLFIIAGVGLLQLYWIFEKKMNILQLITYWMVFMFSISPYYLYLWTQGQFEAYLFWNWILNMHFEGGFSPFKAIIDSLYYNHFIWIFFVLGVVRCFKKGIKDLPLLCLILLGTVFLVQAPYRQYFMPFLPPMCGIAAYGVLSLLRPKQASLVVLIAFMVPMIFFIRTMIVYPNQPQLDKVSWVMENTESADRVYDGDARFNLFRKDIDFFWYSTEPGKGGLGTYKKLKPYTYDVYSAIQKYKPKIISSLFINDLLESTELGNYYPSEVYPDLYIKQK
ncbi:MAG: hypothetical protein ABJF04_07220 [Reichenbachiella sp.]|uniref:ArnT family glycosyltransferase n=1 Tax=Reichenbachiella sp. TaxID=2184521 RepID=UPI003264EB18